MEEEAGKVNCELRSGNSLPIVSVATFPTDSIQALPTTLRRHCVSPQVFPYYGDDRRYPMTMPGIPDMPGYVRISVISGQQTAVNSPTGDRIWTASGRQAPRDRPLQRDLVIVILVTHF